MVEGQRSGEQGKKEKEEEEAGGGKETTKEGRRLGGHGRRDRQVSPITNSKIFS